MYNIEHPETIFMRSYQKFNKIIITYKQCIEFKNMKRRTNLFYNSGNDSKFLTFSNYTECLTGSFLSTNTKLFPSKFICLKVDNLNKVDFIEGLVAYYENKLAVLRDHVIATSNLKIEDLRPLSYLLRYLNEKAVITYIGDITEQDYTGTFTDTICVINTANAYKGTIVTEEFNENTIVSAPNKLYGWYDGDSYFGPETYKNTTALFDALDGYSLEDNCTIEVSKSTESAIEFNVVIPLFTMVQTDAVSTEEQNEMLESVSDDTEILTGTNYINVPLGIWFADQMVTLTTTNKYNESWSLVIGSQFKPFPSSQFVENEITNESNSIAFGTFAQILSRQNDLFTYMTNEIKRLQAQIDEIKNNSITL